MLRLTGTSPGLGHTIPRSKGIRSVSIDLVRNLEVSMSPIRPELEGCVSGGGIKVGKVDAIVPSY